MAREVIDKTRGRPEIREKCLSTLRHALLELGSTAPPEDTKDPCVWVLTIGRLCFEIEFHENAKRWTVALLKPEVCRRFPSIVNNEWKTSSVQTFIGASKNGAEFAASIRTRLLQDAENIYEIAEVRAKLFDQNLEKINAAGAEIASILGIESYAPRKHFLNLPTFLHRTSALAQIEVGFDESGSLDLTLTGLDGKTAVRILRSLIPEQSSENQTASDKES